MKNIVLCGFMGSGKTTIGKLLSKKTGRKFVDTDILIEERAGMKVSQIFETYGENYFRNLEKEVCLELSNAQNLVIATGGGAMTFRENSDALRSSGIVVFLDVTADAVFQRLKNDTTRPLLAKDKTNAVKELLSKRLPVYKSVSHITVKSDRNPLSITEEIMDKYEYALKQ